MKNSAYVLLTIVALLLSPVSSRSQGGATAVPFLLIPPAPEGLGMGGGSASVPTTDAIAPLINPGQLGVFSLANLLSASTYLPRSSWLPQYQLPDMSYGVTAVNAGYNFRSLLSLPFDLSVGLGYSRVSLDLGTFNVTSSSGPTVIGTFQAKEYADDYTVGIGLAYYARLGLGYTYKRIVSALSAVGTEQENSAGTGKTSAADIGLLLDVPILRIVSAISGASLDIAPQTAPFLDLSLGLVRDNVGDAMTYVDPAQADPLPRSAVVGLSLGTGITMTSGKTDWSLLAVRVVHQADQVLVTRHNDGTFDYLSGFGDISFWDNVVLGKSNPLVTSRRGWELQVGEFFAWREGTVDAPGFATYTTSGYSISVGGLMKLFRALHHSPEADGSWWGFAMDHFDLQFHSGKYDQTAGAGESTMAQSLNLVVRHFSF
jgi:hypothetical protein